MKPIFRKIDFLISNSIDRTTMMRIRCPKNTLAVFILINAISACGGGGGSESDENNNSNVDQIIEAPAVPSKGTIESLASPDADFRTDKMISYITYNLSSHDVTLYVYDNRNNLLHRSYIEKGSDQSITYNVSIADKDVKHTWRYRENVMSSSASINDITSTTFVEFL